MKTTVEGLVPESRNICACGRRRRSVVPDGNEHDHEQREDHLHVRYRVHAERAEDQQLRHLQEGEEVDLPLGHFADVVGGRVRRLQGGARGSGAD